MQFYYRNMYVTRIQNFTIIFYRGQGGSGPYWFNVTDTFYAFKGNYSYPTKDELDIFIFEYELRTGLHPAKEIYKGIQADDL